MAMEPGDMCIWHGRLVEVESVNMAYQAMIRFTDEGGIVHIYGVGAHELEALCSAAAGECVLDAVQKAAAPQLTVSQQLERLAEVWLAAPEVGDAFHRPGQLRLYITGAGAGGQIYATVKVWHKQYGGWSSSEVTFESADRLRRTYAREDRPGYELQALSSKRPPAALQWPFELKGE